MTVSPFKRLMVLNDSAEPDFPLLRYAAMLACCAESTSLIVATQAGEAAMRLLVPTSRLAMVSCPNTELAFRVMLQPHLDLLYEMAEEAGCDLIVARHPRGSENCRSLLGRLLYEAPCAVCLMPDKPQYSLRRPLVRVEPTEKGRKLLSVAAAFSRAAGSQELLAVHPYFRYGLELQREPHDVTEQRTLEFYRFLARTDLAGMNCTPLLEESPAQSECLLRLAQQHGSDMLIMDPDADQADIWQWNRREAGALAASADIPLLSLRVAPRRGIVTVLREQVFCGMEPMFN